MTQANLRLDEETFRDKTKAGGGLSKTVGKGSIMRLKRNESIELGTPAAIEPEAKLFALAALVDLAEKAFSRCRRVPQRGPDRIFARAKHHHARGVRRRKNS